MARRRSSAAAVKPSSVAAVKPRPATERKPRFRRRETTAVEARRETPGDNEPTSSLRLVVGKCIQRHRILSEKTQADLADKTSLSLKYVGEIERGEANIRLDTLERLVRGVGWDMAGALSQGPQSLNDGIRTLLRSQLEELGYYLDGVVRWLDALKPDQAPINVTDADLPSPPHMGTNPPRRKR
jgi:transcriptional regulator with XRE-family HTH domain